MRSLSSLVAWLVVCVFVGSVRTDTRATTLSVPVARPPTIVDFARSQIAAWRARDERERLTGRRESRTAYEPFATLAPSARRALSIGNLYLLYVSADAAYGTPGFVNVYPGWVRGPNPPRLGTIAGLDAPTALAFDRFANLYVCQTDVGAPVLIFPFAASKPSAKLDPQGRTPVSIAIAPSGTAYVSTANTPPDLPASILVYPPGATSPARHLDMMGDAIVSLRTDSEGNLYFTDVFVGVGSFTGEIDGSARTTIGPAPLFDFDLDGAGNLLGDNGFGTTLEMFVYSRAGTVLHTLLIAEQLRGFANTRGAFYALSDAHALNLRAYPGGALLDSITALEAYQSFGIATLPRPPYAPAN